ncbi:hypothetical protein [Gloeocapsopsis dulcis]|uniref:Uncharacterized protein n=1 Tax=Gloeocapsopsis dulcis AAB1 = 1H9 TaxID=1433147 RepID=A0A6N8FSN5_9CHRO|nr:hypothetical protein [Gloeocapsopsis dulcis]MUL35335.1 hypothetical protein [Gloeocapsopsis dulcis AAB1 = 1H9]WNN90463.1 hypothetical protein P0S91_05085 [Gloeocapsopsis dulcis]
MTSEEIQKAIEGTLAVQRKLQNTQLITREEIADLKESTRNLNEISQRHERRIEQLLGYSITGEGDRLDLLQRLMTLERRVSRLEQEDNGES